MKVRFIPIAVFVTLLLGSSIGSKAESFTNSSLDLNSTETTISQRGFIRRIRIYLFIKRWIKEHKDYDDVTMSTYLIDDVGMDSLDFIELGTAVDEHFETNVVLTFIFERVLTVGDLVSAIDATM